MIDTDKCGSQRCTGHCCEDFTIPYSPMEAEFWQKVDKHWKQKFGVKQITNPHTREFHQVMAMIEFVRPGDGNVSSGTRGLKHNRKHWQGSGYQRVWHYRCKNFDTEKRICKIYEDRPQMCRNFPHSSKCQYKKCTWKPKPYEEQYEGSESIACGDLCDKKCDERQDVEVQQGIAQQENALSNLESPYCGAALHGTCVAQGG